MLSCAVKKEHDDSWIFIECVCGLANCVIVKCEVLSHGVDTEGIGLKIGIANFAWKEEREEKEPFQNQAILN